MGVPSGWTLQGELSGKNGAVNQLNYMTTAHWSGLIGDYAATWVFWLDLMRWLEWGLAQNVMAIECQAAKTDMLDHLQWWADQANEPGNVGRIGTRAKNSSLPVVLNSILDPDWTSINSYISPDCFRLTEKISIFGGSLSPYAIAQRDYAGTNLVIYGSIQNPITPK